MEERKALDQIFYILLLKYFCLSSDISDGEQRVRQYILDVVRPHLEISMKQSKLILQRLSTAEMDDFQCILDLMATDTFTYDSRNAIVRFILDCMMEQAGIQDIQLEQSSSTKNALYEVEFQFVSMQASSSISDLCGRLKDINMILNKDGISIWHIRVFCNAVKVFYSIILSEDGNVHCARFQQLVESIHSDDIQRQQESDTLLLSSLFINKILAQMGVGCFNNVRVSACFRSVLLSFGFIESSVSHTSIQADISFPQVLDQLLQNTLTGVNVLYSYDIVQSDTFIVMKHLFKILSTKLLDQMQRYQVDYQTNVELLGSLMQSYVVSSQIAYYSDLKTLVCLPLSNGSIQECFTIFTRNQQLLQEGFLKMLQNSAALQPIDCCIKVVEFLIEQLQMESKFLPRLMHSFQANLLYDYDIQVRVQWCEAQLLKYLEQIPREDKVLDKQSLDFARSLHGVNIKLFEILQSLNLHSDQQFLPIDLNTIMRPFFAQWISTCNVEVVVERIIHSDKWSQEDEILNTSSSVHDTFKYLDALVNVFFQLPAGSQGNQFQSGCSDMLRAGFADLCQVIYDALSVFCRLILTKDTDLEDIRFYVFHLKKSSIPAINVQKDRDGTLGYFCRVNNLLYAKQLITTSFINSIKDRFQRNVGMVPSFCETYFEPLVEQMDAASDQMLVYVAKRLVFIDMDECFIFGLYMTENLPKSSLISIVPIINGIIQEIHGLVCADHSIVRKESWTSYRLLALYFGHLYFAFLCIVFLDSRSGRKFTSKDSGLILQDIRALKETFCLPKSDVDGLMLEPDAVSFILSPFIQIAKQLYTQETPVLVKNYESCTIRTQEWPIGVNSYFTIPPQIVALDGYRQLPDFPFNISLLHKDSVSQADRRDSTNPFRIQDDGISDGEDIILSTWQKPFIFCAIAKRAGYGNPQHYQAVETIAGQLKQLNFKKSSTRQQQDQTEQQSNSTDKDAFLFMKKYGMMKMLSKNALKVEKMFNAAKEKLKK
ncbi:hypothetical protein MP228_010071 [Amoeboaphelidium protococcarum]|nr:hypothetical protein MP228_010071 [Amoeboaphelidium protococcarum]